MYLFIQASYIQQISVQAFYTYSDRSISCYFLLQY